MLRYWNVYKYSRVDHREYCVSIGMLRVFFFFFGVFLESFSNKGIPFYFYSNPGVKFIRSLFNIKHPEKPNRWFDHRLSDFAIWPMLFGFVIATILVGSVFLVDAFACG